MNNPTPTCFCGDPIFPRETTRERLERLLEEDKQRLDRLRYDIDTKQNECTKALAVVTRLEELGIDIDVLKTLM